MSIKDNFIAAGLLALAGLCGLEMIKSYKNLYEKYQLKCTEAKCWKAIVELDNKILQDELKSKKKKD